RGAARFHFGGGNFQIYFTLLGVDGDGVAVLHERDGSADIRFGRDVAGDESVAAAGESSVGDERDVFAETFAHDGAGGRKHFSHARPAARPFVSDDDDVAFLDRAVEDAFERGFFGVEHARGAGEAHAFFAGDFRDGAFGGEVAVEHDEVAVFFNRVAE